MARTAAKGLSYVEGKGFRLTIGKTMGDDGVERYRTWWLGQDRAAARYTAERLRECWNVLHTDGVPHWRARDFDLVARIRSVFAGQSNLLMKRLAKAESEVDDVRHKLKTYRKEECLPAAALVNQATMGEKSKASLHGALDCYVETMQKKPLSPSYKRRIDETIGDLKFFRADVPLVGLDRVWLETLTDHIKSRPLARNKSSRTKKREPLSPGTVKTYLQHWRQAFDWIDRAADSARFDGWTMPRRGEELFQVDLNSIRTKSERDKAADGPEQLTIEEIKLLVHAGTDRQRMFVLLGLFCGMGQTELRHCRRDEFDLKAGRFSHRRNKTGQQGQWYLPPELVTLLREYFSNVEPLEDGSAFSTRDRQPVVTDTSDSIRQLFEDLREAAKIDRAGVTFYALRRFLGDKAKRFGGIELRDAALAHAGTSIGDRHYSNYRDFGKVEQLGRAMYRELKKAKVFDWVQLEAKILTA